METPELNPRRQITYIALAALSTAPGILLRITGAHADPVLAAFLYGMAIVGAAFILAWAAEVIQLDIGAGLALAMLALIAVLPEYAVDFVFTSKAGQEFADTGQAATYGPLALANMTGANQLLIGFGWPMVILIGTWRVKKKRATLDQAEGATANVVNLRKAQSVDIAYLAVASLYGMTFFLKDTLTLVDAAILVGIYTLYLVRLSGASREEPHLVGPSAYIGSLPKRQRRLVNYAGFVFAAGAILAVAEPFAESIIELGQAIGVSDFLLVKWIAPLASEAPELLVAVLFAWRLAASTGIGALISSKVNQWTLLVGTLPVVLRNFRRPVHRPPPRPGPAGRTLGDRRPVGVRRGHHRQPLGQPNGGLGHVGLVRRSARRIGAGRGRPPQRRSFYPGTDWSGRRIPPCCHLGSPQGFPGLGNRDERWASCLLG